MSKPGQALLDALKNDPQVLRFQALEAEIEKHPHVFKAYEALKIAQQLYVRAKAHQSPKLDALKAEYERQKKALLDNPWIAEYLDLLEAINHDIQWMIETIERTLNTRLHGVSQEED